MPIGKAFRHNHGTNAEGDDRRGGSEQEGRGRTAEGVQETGNPE